MEAASAVRIELFHPITYDGLCYGRGLHELEAPLARLLLTYKDPVTRKPMAQVVGLEGSPARIGETVPEAEAGGKFFIERLK